MAMVTAGSQVEAAGDPVVRVEVPAGTRLPREEVFEFGVIVSLVGDVGEEFDRLSASRYGTQVGAPAHDISIASRAHRDLPVAGVVIVGVPSFRSDQMPYGGVRNYGIGLEGVHSEMLDFIDERTLVLTELPL